MKLQAFIIEAVVNPSGYVKYPDGMPQDWGKKLQEYGVGIHYDQTVTRPDIVFGSAAPSEYVAKLPTAKMLNEQEWEDYYDNHAHVNDPSEIINEKIVQGILMRKEAEKRDLVIPEHVEEYAQALDPNHPRPGIVRNELKTWKGFRRLKGIELL